MRSKWSPGRAKRATKAGATRKPIEAGGADRQGQERRTAPIDRPRDVHLAPEIGDLTATALVREAGETCRAHQSNLFPAWRQRRSPRASLRSISRPAPG